MALKTCARRRYDAAQARGLEVNLQRGHSRTTPASILKSYDASTEASEHWVACEGAEECASECAEKCANEGAEECTSECPENCASEGAEGVRQRGHCRLVPAGAMESCH